MGDKDTFHTHIHAQKKYSSKRASNPKPHDHESDAPPPHQLRVLFNKVFNYYVYIQNGSKQ